MKNSIPSESLEADMKESAEARYHRNVTNIQLDCRKRLMEIAQTLCDSGNAMIKKNPHRKKEVVDDLNKQWDAAQEMMRKERDERIKVEQEKLCYLLSKISQFIYERGSIHAAN